MSICPQFPPTLHGRIMLPGSKSLCNRALILSALHQTPNLDFRLSDCDDTRVLYNALHDAPRVIDLEAAGTSMRFLTAYFAHCEGVTHVLTGTERMKQRPIGILVDALNSIGADIHYAGEEGFPPLLINGRRLKGGEVQLPACVSSQFVSALLMVAPAMDEGLTLHLEGKIASLPYIQMTLQMMTCCGAKASWTDEQTIRVEHGPYTTWADRLIEGDWSAASYWYAMVALSADADARIELPHLYADSLQGDAKVAEMFRPLGVLTTFDEEVNGAVLTKCAPTVKPDELLELDFADQPDLTQTFVATCAALRQPFRFTGVESLRIKETDRIEALRSELQKFGVKLRVKASQCISVEQYDEGTPRYNGQPIATYDDHRMAMAFAPMALRFTDLIIRHPAVVSKSYPAFWHDIASLGK